MSERKVLNKYFPPDFDPAAIPRRKQAKDAQHKVRLMTPYAMRCDTCGEYIYKGKKFNARKETVEGETYYSIKIFRFYIKCPRCSAEITFKTDPKNTDYVAEHGAQRNFEPWREEKLAGEESKLLKEMEEENNPMKALENRTIDSKIEMDVLDALDEIRTRNARNERVDADALLDKLVEQDKIKEKSLEELLDEADDKLAKAIFHNVDGDVVKRVADEDELDLKQLLSDSAKSLLLPKFPSPDVKKEEESSSLVKQKQKRPGSELGIIVKKKKKKSPTLPPTEIEPNPPPKSPTPTPASTNANRFKDEEILKRVTKEVLAKNPDVRNFEVLCKLVRAKLNEIKFYRWEDNHIIKVIKQNISPDRPNITTEIEPNPSTSTKPNVTPEMTSLGVLLGAYGSDSDSN